MTLSIAPARAHEWEAARWLHARGLAEAPGPTPGWIRDIVHADLAQGRVYLARSADGDCVGTLRLLWQDVEMWPEAPDGEAGYVHGLVVRRDQRCRGLGAQILEWTAHYAHASGRRFLRLDCDAGNLALRSYYENLGFTLRGAHTAETHTGARYERTL